MDNNKKETMNNNKEVEKFIDNAIQESMSQDITLNYDIIANIVEFVKNDREKAEEAYNYFMNRIEIEGDNKAATREAMTKSLEIRNKSIDQLLKLIEIQAKMLIAQKAAQQEKDESLEIDISNGKIKINKKTLIEKIVQTDKNRAISHTDYLANGLSPA